jgi:hypothetical protein
MSALALPQIIDEFKGNNTIGNSEFSSTGAYKIQKLRIIQV